MLYLRDSSVMEISWLTEIYLLNININFFEKVKHVYYIWSVSITVKYLKGEKTKKYTYIYIELVPAA